MTDINDVNLTLETLFMIDRPSERQRVPLRGLMECAGLKPSVDEEGARGYDVTTASIITDEVVEAVETVDHVLLPFTVNSESELGKLLAKMLTLRPCTAIPEYDYAYFGPPLSTEPDPEVTT